MTPAYSARDLARINWYGLKPALLAVISAPLINPLVVTAGRAAPMHLRRRIPTMAPFSTFKLADGRRVKLSDPKRCQVARELYWGNGAFHGRADRDLMSALQTIAERSELFLDIGAYSGLFAIVAAAANPHLRACAYEILPANFRALQNNIWLNDMVASVEPRLMGLSNGPGELVMPLGAAGWTLPSSLSLGSRFDDGVSVPISSLDALYGAFSGKLSMKLDVEGFEPQVLRGGLDLLRRTRPDIICELLPKSDASTIQSMLAPLAYRYIQFTENGPLERERLSPSHDGRDWLLTTSALLL
jgi:FkbM family methyltransferase